MPGKALTNTPSNTYCRAPGITNDDKSPSKIKIFCSILIQLNNENAGTTQGIAAIETIMEHIAWTLKKDPLEVRIANFIQKGDPMLGVPGAKFEEENPLPAMLADLKASAEYDDRKRFVETFNQVTLYHSLFS